MSEYDPEEWQAMFGDDLFRPRDEFDQWNVPGSLRAQALELMESVERVRAEIVASIVAPDGGSG